MTARRSVNIYDYPEHLNPFFEDDNHTKLRFWTNTKRKTRSNSFSFQSIKDFKQSLFSRPARKRSGTSSSLSQLSCYHTHEKNDETPENDETPQNEEFSRSHEKRKSFIYPTLRKLGRSFSIRSKNKKRETSLDRTPQNPENEATYSYSRSTTSNRQTMPAERHLHQHQVDVTPLPRIRFHERLRNLEPEKSNENKPTSTNADDKNPFKDDEDDVKVPSTPSTSKPTTPPRKKKRAPPPPPLRQSSLTRKSLSAEFSMHSPEFKDNTTNGINHKDVEQTEETVTRTKIVIANIENENQKVENEKLKTESSKIRNTNEENKLPKVENELPKIENELPKVENKLPKVENELPKVENELVKGENELPKVENELPKGENELPKVENELPKVENENSLRTENPKIVNVENAAAEAAASSTSEDTPPEELECFEINYNSELNLSSSEMSVSSETKLEQKQQQNAVEDSSDLLELVQKLQLEVEKLTDDTNNNVITSSNFDSGKRPNFYGYDDDDYAKMETTTTMTSSSRMKTEININLDDDDDVVIGAPLSPRLVRLKKDNEWIKH